MFGATGAVADFEASPTEEPRIDGPRVHGRSYRGDGAYDWRPQPYNQEHAHRRTDYVQTD